MYWTIIITKQRDKQDSEGERRERGGKEGCHKRKWLVHFISLVRIVCQYQLSIVFNCDKHVFHYYYTTDYINTV